MVTGQYHIMKNQSVNPKSILIMQAFLIYIFPLLGPFKENLTRDISGEVTLLKLWKIVIFLLYSYIAIFLQQKQDPTKRQQQSLSYWLQFFLQF